ncbi:glycosyltransferase family 4 protein [Sphingopyxis flava]|uniref:Glycosyltransferase involved in cell wall bisynthesis n=1 Tax=Sphingopyxis flava TaxID=1507287 RepID=A0A1T5F677_9SPHN|nr:glycosyltransferase family 4 protein [Sphingopyxis flava]SKB91664.1 Glycosyltransferase involved in cell wall bisynthesis [Sphingopyxis flava]
MHILYFHQHFSTPNGAAGIRSYEMARAAIRAGHNVTMVCGSYGLGQTGLEGPFLKGARRGIVDGIRVIEFDLSYANEHNFVTRTLTFAKYAFSSLKVVMTERYDMVFATTTPLTAGIPGICARWLRGKPFVFEVRDLWPELPREMGVITNRGILAGMSVLEWASYHSAARCVALAPGIARGIALRGVSETRIAIIPNGCDIEIFRGDLAAWRPAGVLPTDLLAIFTGTHGVANGLDAVLDVARVLQDRGRDDIKIALFGEGKLKPKLQARAEREGLRNLIFHNAISKRSLAGLMAGADVGLQVLANVPAFYYGTSPNKFFDYIAAGLPVLNNYPGWLADLIDENQCGFSVPPDDPEAFADSLEAAADDRAALELMRHRALDLAERQFDRNRLAAKWVAWVTEGLRVEATL